MGVSPNVKQLFNRYQKAFNALDIEKNAQFFADSFISAGPKGTITNSKSEFLKSDNKASEFYKSVGQKSAKILTIDEVPITEMYSMIKVHWGVIFKKQVTNP
jgi:hypothetical protein